MTTGLGCGDSFLRLAKDVVGSHQFEEVTEMAAMNAASVKVAKDEDSREQEECPHHFCDSTP